MTRKYETIHRQEHSYPVALMCQWAGVPEVRLLQLAQQAGVGDYKIQSLKILKKHIISVLTAIDFFLILF